MQCLYCGNPNPHISIPSAKSESKGLSEKINISSSYNYNVSAPPKFDCGYCGRCYELIANADNIDFLKREVVSALTSLPDDKLESFAMTLSRYHITVDDILNGVHSVVIPLSFNNKLKKYASKKSRKISFEAHILFKVENRNYALIIYRNCKTGKNIPFTIEKIGGYYE